MHVQVHGSGGRHGGFCLICTRNVAVLIGANQSLHCGPCVSKFFGDSRVELSGWRKGRLLSSSFTFLLLAPFPGYYGKWTKEGINQFFISVVKSPRLLKTRGLVHFWMDRLTTEATQCKLWWGPVGCNASWWLALGGTRNEKERSPCKNGSQKNGGPTILSVVSPWLT